MWVSLEGNIGVGKTTLLSKLSDFLGWKALDERVEKDPEFQELLQEYYQDNSKSIYLQTWLTKRRYNDISSLSKKESHLVERSIFGDVVFTRVNCELGNISINDYEAYYEFAIDCLENIDLPAQIIYLQADPELCFKRTVARDRNCEEGISEDYIKILHDGYESVMMDLAKAWSVSVVTIPYNDFLSAEEVIKQCWLKSF